MRRVWIVTAWEDYGSSCIVAVYANDGAANRRKNEIEAANERYQKRVDKVLSRGEGAEDLPRSPRYYGMSIYVENWPIKRDPQP